MQYAVLVFLGGGLGATARYLLSLVIKHQVDSRLFPYPTLAINLIGAFAIGIVMAWLAPRAAAPPTAQLFLVTGILGGFTTFSAFSYEAMLMLQRSDYGSCAAYIATSVIGTIALVFLGSALVRVAI